MANNKFYGYNPKPSNNKEGNRLDRVNPYEFKKGMDYELMELGCDRLGMIEYCEGRSQHALKCMCVNHNSLNNTTDFLWNEWNY